MSLTDNDDGDEITSALTNKYVKYNSGTRILTVDSDELSLIGTRRQLNLNPYYKDYAAYTKANGCSKDNCKYVFGDHSTSIDVVFSNPCHDPFTFTATS
jgi:hypothetical protein